MLNKKTGLKFLSITLCSVMSLSIANFSIGAEEASKDAKNASDILSESDYASYLAEYSQAKYAADEILINTDMLNGVDNAESVTSAEGKKAVLIGDGNGYAEYRFDVKESGLYNICLEYMPVEDTGMSIRLSFEIDGKSPYDELKEVSFSRIWVNKAEEIEKDEQGNELRPEQKEKFAFRTEWAENDLGLYSKPYAIYLEEGSHSLKISRDAEALFVSSVVLKQYGSDTGSYEAYLKGNSSVKIADKDYKIEAENVIEKSSSTLASTIDNTNAGMFPQSSKYSVVNSFGKDSWKENGQWASWAVPSDLEEGMYILRFRAKQTGEAGTTTYRKLLINGTLPFKEAESIGFKYKDGWQISTFGDNEPYLLRLKPGDIITLVATTGPMAEPLNKIYSSVSMLNDIYQSIIMVTGATPDSERDYNIQKEIPTLLDDIKNARNLIKEIGENISKIMGESNPKVFFINKFETLLNSYLENYRLIVPNLSTFKSYIESYAGETYDFNSLPLELDTILLMSQESSIPNADAGFFKTISFEWERFIYSFASDYSGGEIKSEKKITVWSSLGRDQAQAMKQIIDNEFTPKSNIAVDFKISSTTLPEAILSGREPDVSLSVTQEMPVDLAMRGQALDLTEYLKKMPDEYISQFSESAWTPFKYENGIYAIPITQDFQVMFYRTDVLAELGLKVPDTWNEFYTVLRELQRNNFQVGIRESDSANPGISVSISLFETLLMQNGEEYFKNDLKEVNFESDGGKKAFTDWVRLYRDYDLDVDFDLTSRFRSGEMPLALSSYSFYQTLSTVAPEINGRWSIAPIPATEDGNGNKNRAVSSTLTGTIVLKSAEKRGNADAAFEFISWWADADAQIKYSNVMESLQGVAGRPAVANITAFSKLGWSQNEQQLIRSGMQYVEAVPQVPGTYIINRSLTNALRTSYSDNSDPLRQLSIQCRIINNELSRKKAEFEKNN